MKRHLLLCLSAGMVLLIFSAYGNGPAAGGAGNHTGTGPTPTANCSTGSGCHNTNTTNTSGGISITTPTGGAVTKYTPGTAYKIYIIGSNSANLPRFGFQASCVKASSITTQAGFCTTTASNTSVRTIDGIQLVEQNTPIVGTAGVYQISFNWTAPAAGTGKVRFYSTLNAVNFNGASTNDQPNALPTFDLDEDLAGVGITTEKPAALTLYPNPAADMLHLGLSNSGHCLMRIFDLTGKTIATQNVIVINGEACISVATLKAGNYYILAEQDGLRYGAPFLKQ